MERPIMAVGLDGVSVIRGRSDGTKEDEALTTPFHCPHHLCTFKTLYGLSFARHSERGHKDYGNFAYHCNRCNGNFLTSFALGRHQLRKCSRKEATPKLHSNVMGKALAKKQVASTPVFCCPYPDCDFQIRCNSSFKCHVEVHKKNPNFFYTSSSCRLKLCTSNAPVGHQRQWLGKGSAPKPHSNVIGDDSAKKEDVASTPEFRCPHPSCPYKSRWNANILRHLKVHKTKPDFAYTWTDCKGKLPTSTELGGNQRQCSVFGAAPKPRNAYFAPSASQLAHGKLGCPRCDYVSKTAVRMRSHLLSHDASNLIGEDSVKKRVSRTPKHSCPYPDCVRASRPAPTIIMTFS